MSDYFICIGFSDLLGKVNFNEENGMVRVDLNTENYNTHISLSLTQAKVLSEAIQNIIASVDVAKINKENIYGDIQVEMGNE